MNMRLKTLIPILFCFPLFLQAQYKSRLPADQWVDSVFNSLGEDEKIAQLMVIRAHSNLGADHVKQVTSDIQQYNVGALCFFQGGPVRQANLTNFYQGIAKTPLMVTMDAEYGLGMRLDSVTKFPYQLTLGALDDKDLIYRMGIAIGEQCRRLGVHVNYAPVVDINNNPGNPVIGYRSFGEDKNKVTQYGVAYMKGMQDAGIMACAKHFPGHGDVSVDSHFDLPVISKSMSQLDTLELVPFKALFHAGVGSVMTAHLFVPAIDTTRNKATSISKNSVTGLLRNSLGYAGLSFTDALEMKGVAKYFPNGTIAVEALVAGNDMLCLPASVPETIAAVKQAIQDKKLSWEDISSKVKKVLLAKYQLGLNEARPVVLNNLLNDLNAKTDAIRYEAAIKSLTLLRNNTNAFPVITGKKIAYIGIGTPSLNDFGKRLKEDLKADAYFFSYSDGAKETQKILTSIKNGKYASVIIGIHDYSLRPANNYGISNAATGLFAKLQAYNAVTFVFGNVLALSNFCKAKTLIACYQDDDITQQAAADLFEGKISARGHLPVSVCSFKYGQGIVTNPVKNAEAKIIPQDPLKQIDSIVRDAISQKAFPGCVVLAAHKGSLLYYKAFGNYKYEPSPAISTESIFDLASVTKTSATTLALMKLYEQGRLDIKKKLGDYLPLVKGTNKANLLISDILLHQAGLVPFIRFYEETIDMTTGVPSPLLYSPVATAAFPTRVAANLYLRRDWQDTIMKRILKSPLGPRNKYVYSDLDFIFLGKVVEQITKMPLDQYVQQNFYDRLGLATTGFKPLTHFAAGRIVPTEDEIIFRRQLLEGDVHDEGASLLGGVAGHAGLFSDAYDLAKLYQMLLNGGEFNGVRYLQPKTIDYFTSYHSKTSRRGFGFDKPEKDNKKRPEPYPSISASPLTYGHTGFTGTCVWVDPKYELVFIFLSNRVYPTRNNSKLVQLNVRSKIQEVLYHALGTTVTPTPVVKQVAVAKRRR